MVAPFRLIAYLLHATGLERIYKPRFTRYSALLELSDEVVAKLPKYSHTMTGAQVDPMNLIFVATEPDLKHAFKAAQWYRANPASPLHLLYGLLVALLGGSYKTGPFTPLYVNIALQDLAYQRGTRISTFRRRHHLRIWRTGIVLPGGKRVWVAGASYDTDIKIMAKPPFILHKQDPNFDKERDYVVRSLEQRGVATRLKTVPMTPPVSEAQMHDTALDNFYYTDGRAVVVEL